MRWYRTIPSGAARSLTLLRLFLLASAVILGLGAFVLADRLAGDVRSQAIADQIDSVTIFANAVLSPSIVKGSRIALDPPVLARLGQTVRIPENVRSVKVWRPDGTLAFATLAPERIGRNFGVDGDLAEVVQTGHTVGFIEDLSRKSEPENRAEAQAGIGRSLTVYAPIFGLKGRRPIGVYEVYLATTKLDATISRSTRNLWLTVAAVFGALYAALALLVRGASRRIREQTDALHVHADELRRSYALLEQSSLETIETLNATVEAKDPYTAGHSHRVRAVSLLIGRELGFPEDRLELLGTSALFHDVGKIGVPDAILTKPSKLSPAEFEIVKQHAVRGAEIVANISRLQKAVPAVKHHHERWDGFGYPDGLTGTGIPLEASIVGLADAWDAMTTVRPYAGALSLTAALEQVQEGRGTQFRPDVVDAFMAVSDRVGREALAGRLSLRPLHPVAATG